MFYKVQIQISLEGVMPALSLTPHLITDTVRVPAVMTDKGMEGGERKARASQRQFSSTGSKGTDGSQPEVVLGHQLSVDLRKRAVSLSVSPSGRIFPESDSLAHQLA